MYKLAIVGATGLVGRTVLKILEEKNLPLYEYALFSSKKSEGSIIHFMNKDYIVRELTDNSFADEHFDFAIFFNIVSNVSEIFCKLSYTFSFKVVFLACYTA